MWIKMITKSASPAGVLYPGQVAEVDEPRGKALIAGGYAEAAAGPGREKATAAPGETATSPGGETVTAEPGELRELTVPELRDMAKAHGITGFSALNKDELIDALVRGNAEEPAEG